MGVTGKKKGKKGYFGAKRITDSERQSPTGVLQQKKEWKRWGKKERLRNSNGGPG